MILDCEGGVFYARVRRWSLWHGPRFEYAFDFQAKVVVQVPSRVLLNYEDWFVGISPSHTIRWLRRFAEVAFFFVFLQRVLCRHRSLDLTSLRVLASFARNKKKFLRRKQDSQIRESLKFRSARSR